MIPDSSRYKHNSVQRQRRIFTTPTSPFRHAQVHRLDNWCVTSLGRPIPLYSSDELSRLKTQNPILVMGGIHGDEPEGVHLAECLLQWLTNPAVNRDLLTPWIVIPCLNVDGFAARTRVNGRGVDLNRNYPSKDWTSEHTQARYFPGLSAGSEIEIQSICKLIEICQPRLMIHCHSWNPCIVATGDDAQKDGLRLSQSSGYQLTPEIGYPTPGSLSRYGWFDLRIPVICIEEQDGLKDFSPIWPRFANGFREIFMDQSSRQSPSTTGKGNGRGGGTQ